MKRILVLVIVMMLALVTAQAAEQPASGDMAFGPKYGYFGLDSGMDERGVVYGLEWEGWVNDRISFGLAAFRPRDEAEFSGDFFVALHHKQLFIPFNLGYLNTPDDTATAGTGVGWSIMPRANMRLKFQALASLVLGDLEVLEGTKFLPPGQAKKECGGNGCDPPPVLVEEFEDKDLVYRVEGGVSWVW